MTNFTTNFFAIKLIIIFLIISNNALAQENEGKFLLRDSKVKLSTFYAKVVPGTSWLRLKHQLEIIQIIQKFKPGFWVLGLR